VTARILWLVSTVLWSIALIVRHKEPLDRMMLTWLVYSALGAGVNIAKPIQPRRPRRDLDPLQILDQAKDELQEAGRLVSPEYSFLNSASYYLRSQANEEFRQIIGKNEDPAEVRQGRLGPWERDK